MTLAIETEASIDIVDVTQHVASAISEDIADGLCTVFVPHTTAGIVINEREGRLLEDIEQILDQLVPRGVEYRHDRIDDNAAAHLRTILLGSSVAIPIQDGELALGTWQSVLLLESDGPRRRQLHTVAVGT